LKHQELLVQQHSVCRTIIWPLKHQELLMQQHSVVSNNHLALETSRTVGAAAQRCVEQSFGL